MEQRALKMLHRRTLFAAFFSLNTDDVLFCYSFLGWSSPDFYGLPILPFTLRVLPQDLLGSISDWSSQRATYSRQFPLCYLRWYVPVSRLFRCSLWRILSNKYILRIILRLLLTKLWLVRSLSHGTKQERSFYIGIVDALCFWWVSTGLSLLKAILPIVYFMIFQ